MSFHRVSAARPPVLSSQIRSAIFILLNEILDLYSQTVQWLVQWSRSKLTKWILSEFYSSSIIWTYLTSGQCVRCRHSSVVKWPRRAMLRNLEILAFWSRVIPLRSLTDFHKFICISLLRRPLGPGKDWPWVWTPVSVQELHLGFLVLKFQTIIFQSFPSKFKVSFYPFAAGIISKSLFEFIFYRLLFLWDFWALDSKV